MSMAHGFCAIRPVQRAIPCQRSETLDLERIEFAGFDVWHRRQQLLEIVGRIEVAAGERVEPARRELA